MSSPTHSRFQSQTQLQPISHQSMTGSILSPSNFNNQQFLLNNKQSNQQYLQHQQQQFYINQNDQSMIINSSVDQTLLQAPSQFMNNSNMSYSQQQIQQLVNQSKQIYMNMNDTENDEEYEENSNNEEYDLQDDELEEEFQNNQTQDNYANESQYTKIQRSLVQDTSHYEGGKDDFMNTSHFLKQSLIQISQKQSPQQMLVNISQEKKVQPNLNLNQTTDNECTFYIIGNQNPQYATRNSGRSTIVVS
eukprot:403332174